MSSKPTESSSKIEEIETAMRTTLMVYANDEPKGAAFWFNVRELGELGLSVEDTDTSIAYRIKDGMLRFE